ncbi:MAG TPA: hypothetical protein VN436_10590, partial [Holophaga sp.]|nr:hypothetical protein [Holophaga sp.]
GEMSFSRYAIARERGEASMVGVPHFLMRAFRHRCIITREDSPLTSLDQLAGKRIGLTGWQDSGNTWTRALLRRAAVGIEDARWFVGRLTEDHPVEEDRLGTFAREGRISAMPEDRPLVGLLEQGSLDAVFTAFMPRGFFQPGLGLRQLLPGFRAEEIAYFKQVGYVPGIHVLGLKPELARRHPWLAQALSGLLDESARVWQEKREKYADTTPWLIDELRQTAQDLPATWNRNGYEANEPMIDSFAEELHAQGLTARRLSAAELFPEAR